MREDGSAGGRGLRLSSRLLVIVLVLVSAGVTLSALLPGPTRGQQTTLLSEDFEGTWPGSWTVLDQDTFNGQDYWGITAFRSFGGTRSAWVAQVGFNDILGQNNAAVHMYDNYMDTIMSSTFSNPGNVETLRLSFSYWLESESCCDFFAVWAYDGTWTLLWSDMGSATVWNQVTIDLPPAATGLEFEFYSDFSVVYEGAYVDDIALVAISSPPTSQVSPLPAYERQLSLSVGFGATDPESGVKHVELFFRREGGTWTKYTTPLIPSGLFVSSPITFDASGTGGDGVYDFYTIATDNANNVEQAPGSPDASTTVDTAAPVSSIQPLIPFTNNPTVSLDAQPSDAFGIRQVAFYMRKDGGMWSSVGALSAPPWTFEFHASTDGRYDFYSVATDNAGNVEAIPGVADAATVLDTAAPDLTVTAPTTGIHMTSRDVTVSWQGSDSGSGIDHYEARVGEGSWTPTGTSTSIILQVPDGTQRISVRAYDRAGNVREQFVEIAMDTNPLSPAGPQAGLPLYLIIAVVLLVAFILVVRRMRRAPTKRAMPLSPGAVVPQAPAASSAGTTVCKRCGATTSGTFCSSCGAPLQ